MASRAPAAPFPCTGLRTRYDMGVPAVVCYRDDLRCLRFPVSIRARADLRRGVNLGGGLRYTRLWRAWGRGRFISDRNRPGKHMAAEGDNVD